MSTFRKAERKRSKLRLAICSPSGGGKTYSAILIAQGLTPGGKIAMIDSERGSGELYSDMADYDVAPIEAPFTPARYIALIKDAAAAGYDTLIIDSLSHAWAMEGGVLEMHDRATSASASKNSYMAWRDVTPAHNSLVNAILATDMHVIATMRTKVAYELVQEDGKTKPVKIGMAPIQREGMDYEFTVVFDLSVDKHVASCSKDRTSLFDGKHWVPSAGTGEMLRTWLEEGGEPEPKVERRDWAAEIDALTSEDKVKSWWKEVVMPGWADLTDQERVSVPQLVAERRRLNRQQQDGELLLDRLQSRKVSARMESKVSMAEHLGAVQD